MSHPKEARAPEPALHPGVTSPHMYLFDLERLDVVTQLERWFSWGAIVFVTLMVICETGSHMLSEKKAQLLGRPRTLSTRQFNKLVSELGRLPKGTLGVGSPRTREPQIFAKRFFDAFSRADWRVHMIVSDLPEGELDSGVLFLSYEGNTPPSSPDFSSIEQAFVAADIPYEKVRLPLRDVYTNGVTTSDPVILIGNRFQY